MTNQLILFDYQSQQIKQARYDYDTLLTQILDRIEALCEIAQELREMKEGGK